jgi:hypothetical protein
VYTYIHRGEKEREGLLIEERGRKREREKERERDRGRDC